MKTSFKWLLTFLFVLSAAGVSAGQWGALKDYVQEDAHGKRTYGERYLLNRIIAGEPIMVTLLAGRAGDDTWDYYTKAIDHAYNAWFAYPAKLIRQSGREEEFADILPLLERKVDVRFSEGEYPADIQVRVVPDDEIKSYCGRKSSGCYLPVKKGVPLILVAEDVKAKILKGMIKRAILTHEVGHSLGLSDQYNESSYVQTHEMYSSVKRDKALMNLSTKLTCDDADGLINLIDLSRGRSRGGARGWRSLCKGSDVYYVNGVPAVKGPYSIAVASQAGVIYVDRYEKGRPVERKTFHKNFEENFSPFKKINPEQVEKDGLGRPVYMRGKDGVEVYISYLYGRRVSLVTRQNNVLMYEEKTDKWDKKNNTYYYAQFGEDGIESTLLYVKSLNKKDQGGVLEYVKGADKKAPRARIFFELNEKGEFLTKEAQVDRKPTKAEKENPFFFHQAYSQMAAKELEDLRQWFLQQ